ncbi:2-oxoglutarate-dependent dioxygenase htyE [Callorhinchus milii]|uniref:2-oxoglutarate-dependent dioxygenase htyE n=1 Tax=Callorhinchus milii TaxID=7868 RepID=UPI001C3FC0C4|nr:2-oxoglutarate-dependent dioxygenase htyE [Callorhinchus milii]
MDIAVVDFGSFGLGKAQPSAKELQRLSSEMMRAFTDIGFVYLKNTGFEQQNVFRTMEICKKFFVLPRDIKNLYSHSVDSNVFHHGWVPGEAERLNPNRPADQKEAYDVTGSPNHVRSQSTGHCCTSYMCSLEIYHPWAEMDITVVDFSSFGLGKAEPSAKELQRLGSEITRAFTDIGFVYLKNTGFQQQNVFKTMEICKNFFMLPRDTKIRYARAFNNKHQRDGWIERETERLNLKHPADLKEAFNLTFPIIKWPSAKDAPEFKGSMESFFKQCDELAHRIMKPLELGLGLERDFFINKHKLIGSDSNPTTLRALYYPPVQKSSVLENQMRCGEHSDYGTFTLLFQDENGGLEVMNRSGEYVAVPYIPNTVLVNIGDLMQRWTADILTSTMHRVKLPESDDNSERQSLAFFVHPDNEAIITCCDGSNKYPPVSSLQYVEYRLAGTYERKKSPASDVLD